MNNMVQEFSPARIPLLIDANKIAYGAFLSTFPQGAFHEEPGLCWFETDVSLELFNGVLQTRLETQALPAAITRIVAHFGERQLPFQWHVGPSSQPQDFGSLLEAYGISHVEDEPGMAVDLLALNETLPVASGLSTQPVTAEAGLQSWANVWGCGAPEVVIRQWVRLYSGLDLGPASPDLGPASPLRFYLGTLAGEPVATSALFLGAGVAAVEHVVTLPQARRQGIGGAMTLHAAREARKAGYRVGVLTASPMGINIYRRLGFREYCIFSTYGWQPTSD